MINCCWCPFREDEIRCVELLYPRSWLGREFAADGITSSFTAARRHLQPEFHYRCKNCGGIILAIVELDCGEVGPMHSFDVMLATS